MQKSTVLVSGASGFIASHIVRELLERNYKVVGTVRNLNNIQKYDFLLKFPNAQSNLQLRQADLLNQKSWDTAMAGAQFVLHVASPIPPGIPKDQNQLIKPAVEGTKNIIQACLKNKIKRLIFTSSSLCASIRSDEKRVNQQDWSEYNLLQHYSKSKYLAQKLFWEEAQKHKNELQFVSILPSLVIGPAFTKHFNSSQALTSEILNGGYPGIPTPQIHYSAVDVRDVAVAQVNALQYPNAKGKRFLVSGFEIKNNQIFQILRNKYGPLGYKVPQNLIGADQIKKSGHPLSLRSIGFLGKKFELDNSRGIKQLGMNYREAYQSIVDQVQKQIQLKIVSPTL